MLRHLGPEEARVALSSLPALGAAQAERYAADSAAYTFSGRAFVLRQQRPPQVSVRTTHLPVVDEQLCADAATWEALEAALADTAPAERLTVRSRQPREVLEARGLRVMVHELTKLAEAHPPRPDLAVSLATSDAEWAFVADLLCEALRAGMPDSRFTDADLEAYLHGRLRLGQPDGTRALVGRIDGTLAGHISWRPTTDELTGEPLTELVDVFVVDPFTGTGVTQALTEALEDYLTSSSDPRVQLGTVVGEPDATDDRIVAALQRAGWQWRAALWQRSPWVAS